MVSINPAFQVLISKGNQAIAAAGLRLDELLSGQVGFFSYNTNLTIDGTKAHQNKSFYIAVGISSDNNATTASTSVDVMKSAGANIDQAGVRAFTSKPAVAPVDKKVVFTFGKVQPLTDYALKFEIRNSEAYANFGFNTPSKTFSVMSGEEFDTDTGLADANKLVVDLAAEIALDDEALFTTRFLDPTDGSVVTDPAAWRLGYNALAAPVLTAATPSTSGGTLPAGVHRYAMASISANGESVLGTEFTATTTGATSSVAVTFPDVTGATGYKLYRGDVGGATSVYTSYITSATSDFLDTNQAGTVGAPPATGDAVGIANEGETLQLEVSVSAVTALTYSGVNLGYLNPRGTEFIPSIIGFGTDTTVATTVDLVYEQTAGYDIAQMEYVAAGWNGSPYRNSDVTGFTDKSLGLANKATRYHLISVSYENIGIGAGEKYQSSLQTNIAIPAADTTTLQNVVDILNLMLTGLDGSSQVHTVAQSYTFE